MRTLTFFQHSVLQLARSTKKGFEPFGDQNKEAASKLTTMGLLSLQDGKYYPVNGTSYNFRGNRHFV